MHVAPLGPTLPARPAQPSPRSQASSSRYGPARGCSPTRCGSAYPLRCQPCRPPGRLRTLVSVVRTDRFQVVSTAPGKVEGGKGVPIEPSSPVLETRGNRCRPSSSARIEWPVARDASILLVMTAAPGEVTRSGLTPAAESESPPPRAPSAVARLAPPSKRSTDAVRQFSLVASMGDALGVGGLCGLTHLLAPLSIEAREPDGSLGTQARSGSRRGGSEPRRLPREVYARIQHTPNLCGQLQVRAQGRKTVAITRAATSGSAAGPGSARG